MFDKDEDLIKLEQIKESVEKESKRISNERNKQFEQFNITLKTWLELCKEKESSSFDIYRLVNTALSSGEIIGITNRCKVYDNLYCFDEICGTYTIVQKSTVSIKKFLKNFLKEDYKIVYRVETFPYREWRITEFDETIDYESLYVHMKEEIKQKLECDIQSLTVKNEFTKLYNFN